MARQHLHVARGAGRARDEGAPPRVRRTAYKARFARRGDEPVDDAFRSQPLSARRAHDERFGIIWRLTPAKSFERAAQVTVHRYASPSAALGDRISNIDDRR